MKKQILILIAFYISFCAFGYCADETASSYSFLLFLTAYVFSLIYTISFLRGELRGCLSIIFGILPFIMVVLGAAFLIPLPLYIFLGYKINKERTELEQINNKILDKFYQKSSRDDIWFKNLIIEEIRFNGGFFCSYEYLSQLAEKALKNKDYNKFICVYILFSISYESLDSKARTNKLIKIIRNFLEKKSDKYNYELGKIYQEVKDYNLAVESYKKVDANSNFYYQAQELINKCTKLQEEKERLINEAQEKEIKEQEEVLVSVINEYNDRLKDLKYDEIVDFIKLIEDLHALKSDNKQYNDTLQYLKQKKSEYDEHFNSVMVILNKYLLYNNCLRNLENGNYKTASENVQELINTYPDNKYIELSNKIENRMVDIKTCSKGAILTLDGFNEEMADRFIEERSNGKIYYDINLFVSDYGLQPHQVINIQDRLIFPPKPMNKAGRQIDY